MVRYHLVIEQRHVSVVPHVGVRCHTHHYVAVHCLDAVPEVEQTAVIELAGVFGMGELKGRKDVDAANLVVDAGR